MKLALGDIDKTSQTINKRMGRFDHGNETLVDWERSVMTFD